MTGLRVSEGELRALFVTELEAVEEAEFGKALLMSDQLKIPCSPATPTPSVELRSRAA